MAGPNGLPSELQRAEHLCNRLHKAISIAKQCKQPKAAIEIAEAEELLQLISDSLRTAQQFNLVEFDGSIKPQARIADGRT
jgi:hypothetical protein